MSVRQIQIKLNGQLQTSCYNRAMKILLYTYDIMKIGGIETSFYNLAQYLKAKGHEVGVRYSIASDMQLSRYKAADIDIRAVKQETCDVLLIGSIWKQPQLINAKLTVQQVHADWSDKFWKGAPSALQMIHKANKTVDMYACVSDSSGRFVSKATNKPIITMNNLAPDKSKTTRKLHGNSTKKLVFAAFTRMTSEKGLKNYQAFRKRVEELGINAEFRVYTNGDAPDGWKLYEPVPDIRTELPAVDFVCSLADTESFGYTIAEANSCSVPCVIKRCNSTAEFWSDKDNLILDNVEDFSAKDLSKKVTSYNLRSRTEKSVDDAIETFSKMKDERCIIRSMRSFYDLESKVSRHKGEIFNVSKKRASELLSNKLKLVEVL